MSLRIKEPKVPLLENATKNLRTLEKRVSDSSRLSRHYNARDAENDKVSIQSTWKIKTSSKYLYIPNAMWCIPGIFGAIPKHVSKRDWRVCIRNPINRKFWRESWKMAPFVLQKLQKLEKCRGALLNLHVKRAQ